MFTDCYCTQLRRAARALTVMYDAVLTEDDIRVTQLALLRALDRMGSATVQELSEEVALDKGTISRNAKVLRAEGWVIFEPAKDMRLKRMALSSKGTAKLNSATLSWQKAQAKVREAAQAALSSAGDDPLLDTLRTLKRLPADGSPIEPTD